MTSSLLPQWLHHLAPPLDLFSFFLLPSSSSSSFSYHRVSWWLWSMPTPWTSGWANRTSRERSTPLPAAPSETKAPWLFEKARASAPAVENLLHNAKRKLSLLQNMNREQKPMRTFGCVVIFSRHQSPPNRGSNTWGGQFICHLLDAPYLEI